MPFVCVCVCARACKFVISARKRMHELSLLLLFLPLPITFREHVLVPLQVLDDVFAGSGGGKWHISKPVAP